MSDTTVHSRVSRGHMKPMVPTVALMTSSPRSTPVLPPKNIQRSLSGSIGNSSVSISSAQTASVRSSVHSKTPLKPEKKGFTFSLGEDENKERGNWSGRLDFILSSIGLAVGLGNVWRFPYLCYRNGGGAFLIPYTIMLAFAGLPLLYFELALGQYSSLGLLGIWKIVPMFKGIGYAMVMVTVLCSAYYNVIIAYVIFYFFASLTSEVPWKDCNHDWNSDACTSFDNTSNVTNHSSSLKSPAEDYWERYVLDLSPGIDEPGTVRWSLALCLLLAWLVIFLCLLKGIKTTGKVVYFTALFPYFVLFILLIRGATLPGSIIGIVYYMVPDFNQLASARVWGQAAMQIFYSLGPAFGSMITMSSYNRFNTNCYRDAIIIAVVNCGTSIFAGFVIFSVLGFMSHEYNIPVDKVADSGPGLAFVAYPAGLAMMPGAPFWSAVFFFMLFTLGLDSQFAFIESIVSAFADEYPEQVRPRKTLFTLCVCIFFYFLGLPQVTQGGVYWMNLLDWYAVGFSLLVIGLVEIVVVMYAYGYGRFAKDVQCMLGFMPNWYWLICWMGLTPLSIVIIIIFYCVLYEPITYNEKRYPKWAEVIGWLTVVSSLIFIPIWILIRYVKLVMKNPSSESLASRMCSRMLWREMIQPAHDWGPALPQHRKLRQELDAAELEIDKILDHDPNLTVDSIDFRVPYHLYNSCSNSAYSSRSDLTMYESHV